MQKSNQPGDGERQTEMDEICIHGKDLWDLCLECPVKPVAEVVTPKETRGYKPRDWDQPHLKALNYLNNCKLDDVDVSIERLREILDVPDVVRETTDSGAAPTENLLDRARLLIHRAQQCETFKSDIWWKYEYFLRDSLAAPKPSPQEFEPDNYIGWAKYAYRDEWPTRLVLCDSDADGAFKIYRNAARKAPSCDQVVPTREAVEKALGADDYPSNTVKRHLRQMTFTECKMLFEAVLSKATGEGR